MITKRNLGKCVTETWSCGLEAIPTWCSPTAKTSRPLSTESLDHSFHPPIMITDTELNSIAIFCGTLMMGLIVFYHFLSVNGGDMDKENGSGTSTPAGKEAPKVPEIVLSN